ncbi:MAG: GNAT family N-acetyltransferase [Burkholderiales bacterium]|nr:GNAT family N-acetyltransferase [Burkholderiales bacterium]
MHKATSCQLDALRPTDAATLMTLFTSAAVRTYLGGPLTVPEAVTRRDALIADAAHPWTRAVRLSPDSALIGLVMLDRHHDLDDLEISYLFLPAYWGQGHATAAVSLHRQYAFDQLKLPRIVAETQSANIASIRLLQRLGFAPLQRVIRFGVAQSIFISHARSTPPLSTH